MVNHLNLLSENSLEGFRETVPKAIIETGNQEYNFLYPLRYSMWQPAEVTKESTN